MKKFVRIIAVALLAVMALSLVACSSSFGKIKSNFEKNGYVYVEDDDGNGIFDSFTADLEEGEISCTLHVFKAAEKEKEENNSSLGSLIGGAIDSLVNAVDYCGVIEFKSDKDMQKALADNETLKGLIADAQDSDLVNGNCILITCLVNIEEKIEIFNKSK